MNAPARLRPEGAGAHADDEAVFHSDGAARGNPGPAAFGVVAFATDGAPLYSRGEAIGDATNNVAEYRGVLHALAAARELGLRRFTLFLDSELLVKQLSGQYRVKAPGLRPLYQEAVRLLAGFERVTVRHVRREGNSEADALANEALDRARR